jgi:phenylacetate-CoA ligase
MLGLNNIYKHFNSTIYVFYYLYEIYKHNKNPFLDPPELKKLQVEKLKKILQHAYNKVGYYRKIFDQAGIKPDNINSLQDLAKIPITGRKDIQGLAGQEITAGNTDLTKCGKLRTSGSTGMPLDIFVDNQNKLFLKLFYMRMYFANGRKIKDKVARIVTPQFSLLRPWFRPIQYKLRFLREEHISIFESPDNILKMLNRYQPDIIISHPSTVKELAREIREKNIKGIFPRMIFLTGEMLSAEDRAYISSIFNAEVFDFYASNEFGLIAWECKEHFGYHINSDNVIVEFIKEDGTYAKEGEEAEIVLTSLNSYTMPFIRYRIGDMGIPSDEKCPCGRSLPLIKMLAGRANDYIILPDGKKISPFFLTCEIEKFFGIAKYQVLQEARDKIKINIVKEEMFSEQAPFGLKRNIKRLLGEDIEVEIEFLDNTPKDDRSNKFITVISRINK